MEFSIERAVSFKQGSQFISSGFIAICYEFRKVNVVASGNITHTEMAVLASLMYVGGGIPNFFFSDVYENHLIIVIAICALTVKEGIHIDYIANVAKHRLFFCPLGLDRNETFSLNTRCIIRLWQ